jgi:hypothetical protein
MKFWDEHADQRDKFAILAIHNPEKSAPDFETLDKLLEQRGILKQWGRNLPFTVILDNSETSTENYGVEGYPTTILIDPEGKVVKGEEHELQVKLAAKLREMKQASPPKEGADQPGEKPPEKVPSPAK